MDSPNHESKAAIIKIQGGLGNQFFQYALGRSLKLTHGFDVTFDLSWYPTQSLRHYELDKYQVQLDQANPETVQVLQKTQRTGILGRLQSLVSSQSSKYFQDFNPGFNPKVFKLAAPVYLDGYWQSYKYFIESADMIRQELRLKETPTGANQDLLDQIQASPSISLHVRRGDYVSSATTNAFHGTASLDYYQVAIKAMQKVSPGATIYVFSDDQAWVRENLKFPMPTVFVDINGDDQAHQDLRLMSACQHHVIANSTFSWWGAWLNPNQEKTVIAPKQWFASKKSSAVDIIPDDWQTL